MVSDFTRDMALVAAQLWGDAYKRVSAIRDTGSIGFGDADVARHAARMAMLLHDAVMKASKEVIPEHPEAELRILCPVCDGVTVFDGTHYSCPVRGCYRRGVAHKDGSPYQS